MTNKIRWLAALFTLVYWLGNAWGCSSTQENENYRILEEDRKMFDTQLNPDRPGASEAPLDEAAPVETAASLNGIDRSHWPTITTSAGSGTITYNPVYFTDLPLDPAAGATGPMAMPNNAGLDKTNTIAIVLQPLKFGWDFAMLPYNLFTDPPAKQEWRVPGKWSSSGQDPVTAAADNAEDVATVESAEPAEVEQANETPPVGFSDLVPDEHKP